MRLGARPALLLLALAGTACGKRASGEAPPAAQTMRGVRMVESLSGRTQWRLDAEEARLSEQGDLVDVEHPSVVLQEAGKDVTRVSARWGRFDVASRDLRLEREVKAVSLKESSTLYTSLLNYDASKQRVWTDRAVRIERAEGTVRGVGFTAKPDLSEMTIDKQEGRIK